MSAVRAPKPTRYAGVRFRSKSEAMFARALDLSGPSHWIYEPFKIGDYCPDFLVDYNNGRGPFLVEYKPSRPTPEYVEYIYQTLDLARGAHPDVVLPEFEIVAGSFFNDEPWEFLNSRVSSEWRPMWSDQPWFPSLRREVMSYRFDLLQ